MANKTKTDKVVLFGPDIEVTQSHLPKDKCLRALLAMILIRARLDGVCYITWDDGPSQVVPSWLDFLNTDALYRVAQDGSHGAYVFWLDDGEVVHIAADAQTWKLPIEAEFPPNIIKDAIKQGFSVSVPKKWKSSIKWKLESVRDGDGSMLVEKGKARTQIGYLWLGEPRKNNKANWCVEHYGTGLSYDLIDTEKEAVELLLQREEQYRAQRKTAKKK